MTAPGAAGRRSVARRLAGIGLLAAAVTGALYAAGRLHTPNYAFSLFGQTGLAAVTLKSLLASVVLGLAALQVLLALWIYRKLPLAGGPPRPVRPLFSPERAGWAPPGPGVPAAPLPAGDAVLPPAADVLVADAVSALARTPPLMTPAASRPTAPACRFLRPRVFAESDMVISFLPWPPTVAALAPPCLRHLSAPSDRAMRRL